MYDWLYLFCIVLVLFDRVRLVPNVLLIKLEYQMLQSAILNWSVITILMTLESYLYFCYCVFFGKPFMYMCALLLRFLLSMIRNVTRENSERSVPACHSVTLSACFVFDCSSCHHINGLPKKHSNRNTLISIVITSLTWSPTDKPTWAGLDSGVTSDTNIAWPTSQPPTTEKSSEAATPSRSLNEEERR